MTIPLIMLPLLLLFVGVAIAVFFWTVNRDQFKDMDSPGLMPLSDHLPSPLSPSDSTLDPAAMVQVEVPPTDADDASQADPSPGASK